MYQVDYIAIYLETQLVHNYKYMNNKVFQVLYLFEVFIWRRLTVLPFSTVVKLNLKRNNNGKK